MIEAMDDGIGQIAHSLDENNLLESTLIFFCSDNGAVKPGSNAPLNGFKGNVWEGGHRVPAIAYWKNEISPGEVEQTVLSMDIFPTIVDLTDRTNLLEIEFDGASFLGLLKDSDVVIQSRKLFWKFGDNKKAVRFKNWKYIKHNQEEYLFNLSEDIEEGNNLIDSFPDLVDSLTSYLHEWEEDMSEYSRLTD
jgi:arylsulfatase A-like enzyme